MARGLSSKFRPPKDWNRMACRSTGTKREKKRIKARATHQKNERIRGWRERKARIFCRILRNPSFASVARGAARKFPKDKAPYPVRQKDFHNQTAQHIVSIGGVTDQVVSEKELLHLAAHVERYSSHPIAISLKNAYPDEADGCSVENVEEIAGHGVRAVVNGKTVCVGSTKMMDAVGAKWKPCEKNGTIVHVSVDGTYVGHIVVSDRIKADSADAIKALKAEGVTKTVMLTGDKREVGEYVASAIGLDEFHAELLPADKVSELEKLLDNKPSGKTLAFVGDGINDAPVLARADLGIAMGGLGSDAAIEAADVVLMDDKPSKIALGVKIARKTLRLARENTFFAIFIKLLVLVLAVLGIATMWMAVFADVGVTVLAVLNAMRALKV